MKKKLNNYKSHSNIFLIWKYNNKLKLNNQIVNELI